MNRTTTVLIACALIATLLLLVLKETNHQQNLGATTSITVDDNTYTFSYTDDFVGEDIIIKSNEQVYSGLHIPVVFSVTNNAIAQNVTISLIAPGNTQVAFEGYEAAVNRPITTYECLATKIPTTTIQTIDCSEPHSKVDHNNVVPAFTPLLSDNVPGNGIGLALKPVPQGYKSQNSFTVAFQANETRYFRLILYYDKVKDKKRDFVIEAVGSVVGYGQLR